jgi:hypothetical protein
MDIDVEQARRRAKELLRAARAGDEAALAQLRGDRAPRLADGQRAVARELGFRSWPALVRALADGRHDLVDRLLDEDPGLASYGLDLDLVLGDDARVAAALRHDPELVARDLPGLPWRPLALACQSVFLQAASPRADGVRRVVAPLSARAPTRTTARRSPTPSRPATPRASSSCFATAPPSAGRAHSAWPWPRPSSRGSCSNTATCGRPTASFGTPCSSRARRRWSSS